ncbi:MAG: hypothetical protein H6712_21385 [Myxococcales bacterium]|nr:hypothetical protein [Myxococcales bacterium]MCB9716430.1 hypothetical protein [Myxococcales bacterium]
MSYRPVLLSLLTTLALGCLSDEPSAEPNAAALSERCVGCDWGPPILNTHEVNGISVPALALDGTVRNGARLVEVAVLAAGGSMDPLVSIQLERGLLSGTTASGTAYEGADFVGSAWTVELGEGPGAELVLMTISDFIDDDPHSRYVLEHGPTIATATSANCEVDPVTGEASAILFDDLSVDEATGELVEETGSIYFGCISGAVGKAAMWGYVPWDHGRDAHQTTTRVVRADYCGDGKAWTVTGTPLQLEDEAKINEFLEPDELTEAMWGPDGAVCLRTPRYDAYAYATVSCDGLPLPKCGALDELADWPTAIMWSKRWDLLGPALW